MIKSEKGNVQLKGLGIEILADFVAITQAIFEHLQENISEQAEELIRDCLEIGLIYGKEDTRESTDDLDKVEELLKTIRWILENDRN